MRRHGSEGWRIRGGPSWNSRVFLKSRSMNMSVLWKECPRHRYSSWRTCPARSHFPTTRTRTVGSGKSRWQRTMRSITDRFWQSTARHTQHSGCVCSVGVNESDTGEKWLLRQTTQSQSPGEEADNRSGVACRHNWCVIPHQTTMTVRRVSPLPSTKEFSNESPTFRCDLAGTLGSLLAGRQQDAFDQPRTYLDGNSPEGGCRLEGRVCPA